MFVTILTYKVNSETVLSNRPLHLEFLDKYYDLKIFMMSGRQISGTGGIIIANCKTESELWEILKQDPFYINGIADYQVIEFTANKFVSELNNLLTN